MIVSCKLEPWILKRVAKYHKWVRIVLPARRNVLSFPFNSARSPAFPTCASGFGFTGVHYNRALTMRGLHGVSTVHESEPLMHQAISAVPCLWGFAWKWVLFKTCAAPPPPHPPTPNLFWYEIPILIMNTDFLLFFCFVWRNVGLDKVGQFWRTFLDVLWREQTVAARHICTAAVAENGITKSVTNLIRSLISNKLA